MKIYIAGKITGDPNFKEKFEKAEQELRLSGDVVLNPAELPSGMNPGDYMRICLSMVDSADVILFLPDYADSPGAQIELKYANYIGKEVMFA
jgi:nucleoside 2-deoxyribosyltransferase